MDFEFDKEIDALLRQTAQGETAFAAANPKSKIQNPKSQHLDADEISAFAEHALPEKIRQKYTAHFADCENCRKNLSSLILLNAETESVPVQAEDEKIILSPIPWYRKLFAFPNLAYTLGALVLVFSGIVAYTVTQSVNNFEGAEVSQISEISERPSSGKGMSSEGDAAAVESYSSNAMMSNTASTNSASNSSTSVSNSAMPSAPVVSANSNATAVRDKSDQDLKAEPKPAAPQKEPIDLVKADDSIVAVPSPSPKENEYQVDGEAPKQQPNLTQNSMVQNQTDIAPDSRNVKRAPSTSLRADGAKSKKLEEAKDDAREKSAETTIVSGKAFKRANNAWIDSAYQGQPTINITRGTKEYKKLDKNLRGIAENLGGTVVVIWKAKAYRLQ